MKLGLLFPASFPPLIPAWLHRRPLTGPPAILADYSRTTKDYTHTPMTIPTQPNIKLVNRPDYRETYANSVQVRVNVWDFWSSAPFSTN